MRALRGWLVYLAVVLLGGTLVAPWLYHLAQWTAAHLPGLEGMASQPFHRYVSRCLMVLALGGLWPLGRWLGLKSRTDVGLDWRPNDLKRLGLGFALGFVSLALVAGVVLVAGARHWDWDRPGSTVVRHVVNASLAAALVSPLEEVLFRGALFGTLARGFGWVRALLASSVVYAWLHFFARGQYSGPVEWTTGLVVLGQMMRGFVEVATLIPGFINLAVAGVCLGLAYHRTGTLACSVGLHAGWIFWLKTYAFITREAPGATAVFWGTGRLIDGWVALLALGSVGCAVACWTRTKATREEPDGH